MIPFLYPLCDRLGTPSLVSWIHPSHFLYRMIPQAGLKILVIYSVVRRKRKKRKDKE